MTQYEYFKSLRRALSVLKCFSPEEMELSGAAIARKLGIHRTTAYRLLAVLEDEGLTQRDSKTGMYTIGPELFILGNLYLNTMDLHNTAEPVIETLNDLTHEAVSVAILDKSYVTIILREESRYALRWHCHTGTIVPAYASVMGKALLSELSEEELDRFYPEETLQPLTKKTIATTTELKQELERIRETGVAFDREGSYEGVEGIGTVIRNANGKAIAGISISTPITRLDETKRSLFVTLVKMGAGLISYRLGYQDNANPVKDIKQIRLWWKQNSLDLSYSRA